MEHLSSNLLTSKSIFSMVQKIIYHWWEKSEAGWSVKQRSTHTASNGHTRSHICTVLFLYSSASGLKKNDMDSSLVFLSVSSHLNPTDQTIFYQSFQFCCYSFGKWRIRSWTGLSHQWPKVPQLSWKEKRKHMKLILFVFPVKWMVCVKQKNFYWWRKYDTYLMVRSEYLYQCWVEYQCKH